VLQSCELRPCNLLQQECNNALLCLEPRCVAAVRPSNQTTVQKYSCLLFLDFSTTKLSKQPIICFASSCAFLKPKILLLLRDIRNHKQGKSPPTSPSF
jgi:hypothetical protein